MNKTGKKEDDRTKAGY